MMTFASHSIFARPNRSAGVSDSNPAPYHSPMEYRLRTFGFFGVAIRRDYQDRAAICNPLPLTGVSGY